VNRSLPRGSGRVEEQAGRCRAAFEALVGQRPEGIWAAPGRINLIGEHTDYNDGLVLPMAIDRHVVTAVARRSDDRVRLWSRQEAERLDLRVPWEHPDRIRGWSRYVVGVAWSLAASGVEVGGFDLVLDGDVPPGAGLASSAAVECVVALALSGIHGGGLSRSDLAVVAQRAEVEFVGVPCGVMDQMASLTCRSGFALMLDTRSLASTHVPFRPETAGLDLVVIDTGLTRRLTEGAYGSRRQECLQAARVLGVPALRDATMEHLEAAAARLGEPGYRRARHVISENRRVLEFVAALRRGDWTTLGSLLTASHGSLRDDFDVSSPELETAVATARAAGARGARMTGAGFGGCAIALVPTGTMDALRDELERAFERSGHRPPKLFAAAPVDGARRIA
jgi:galactokinase